MRGPHPRRQLEDGGWNIYEGRPSGRKRSVKAYFALNWPATRPAQPWMQEAARASCARWHPKMNPTRSSTCAARQFPWRFLPTVPVEIMFMPRWFFFDIYEVSSWSRAMLMPLAILIISSPPSISADKQLHELYPIAGGQRSGSRLAAAAVLRGRISSSLRSSAEGPAQPALAPMEGRGGGAGRSVDDEAHGQGSDGLAAFPRDAQFAHY